MGMKDPKPTFSHLVTQLRENHPNLAYLHIVEPRVDGSISRDNDADSESESNQFIRDIWAPRPIIAAGAFTRETALHRAEEQSNELVAFGRMFISNVSRYCHS